MAWSDVSSVILRIGELLTQEATSLWGVEEQVDRLQTELKWMQSFLIDADARRDVWDKGIKGWRRVKFFL
ncbi:Rx [Theobroma cacao]|nr:Rx [Theobroma cacao]